MHDDIDMTATADLPDEGLIPEWDLADRLTKSLRVRDLSVSAMAEAFGVSRNTVGRWINGHGVPSKSVLVFWAILTGVDQEWLETGRTPADGPGSDSLRACRDSNPKPSDP